MEDVSAWGFAILRKSLSFNKYKRRGGMAMKIKKIYKSFSLALLMLALLLIWDVKVEAKVEKNENDVVAIKEIIKKLQGNGATVGDNINDDYCYKWSNKTGRLIEINWWKKKIKGELDLNELTCLKKIDCSGNRINLLKINELKNLRYLDCSSNKLKSLEISELKKLRYLLYSDNELPGIKVNDFKELRGLYCSGNNISKIDVHGLSNLRELMCNGNKLTKLNLKSNNKITFFDCSSNKLKKLEIIHLKKLTELNCEENKISKNNNK